MPRIKGIVDAGSPVRGAVGVEPDVRAVADVTTVDDQMSATSSNPVQNKVIAAALEIIKALTAPIYSSSATYRVGDYCTYGNYMYRCNTAISTPEEFNILHWNMTTAGYELYDLKTAMSALWQPPASPTADGTYSLVDVVSRGVPSYAWEEAVTYAELLAAEWGN